MNNASAPTGQTDNPAQAFAELRNEVSLLRRAIEGLTAERQNAPDYTPTLITLSKRLTQIEGFMGEVAESPAMRLTPENLATRIAKASETVRASDRETIRCMESELRTSILSINEAVKQAWTAGRQLRYLYWAAGGGVVVGASGVLSAWYLIG